MAVNGGYVAPNGYQNLAETDRQILRALAQEQTGVTRFTGLRPALYSGLRIQVAPGSAFIPGMNVPTTQGYYFGWLDDREIVSHAAAGTLGRRDRVVLAVRDQQYGALPSGTQQGASIVVVQGTPSSSAPEPSDAAVQAAVGPGGWLELYMVHVPANATSFASINLLDRRVFTWGKDYLNDQLDKDTGWVNMTLASGNGTPYDSANRPQVRRIGNMVYMRGGWSAAQNTYDNEGNTMVRMCTVPSWAVPKALMFIYASAGGVAGNGGVNLHIEDGAVFYRRYQGTQAPGFIFLDNVSYPSDAPITW